MAHELASAYVSLSVNTSGIPAQIQQALNGASGSASSVGASMGSKLAGALGKTLKAGAIGAGVAAGGVLAASITKGIGRLTAIDDAQGKLKGLGHDTEAIATIMDSAMASVKGTAFGLGDAATVAATAVAAGIKPGQDLTKYLSMVGDAATIAGSDLSEMGSILNGVQTSGTAMNDSLGQLADRGIPIYQWLGEEMGIAAGEVSDFASKGKVSSEVFFAAIQKNIGGAALAGGETVRGAFSNMNAALGRFGAAVAGPIFNQAVGGFGSLTEAIDNATTKVKPLAAAFEQWLTSDGIPKLKEYAAGARSVFEELRSSTLVSDSVERLGGVFTALSGTAVALWPSIQKIAETLSKAAAATGVSAWQVFLGALEAIAPILDATLVPALRTIASLMENNQGAVTALVLAFAAFKTLPAMFTRLSTPIAAVGSAAASAVGKVRQLATTTGSVVQAGSLGAVTMGRFGSAIATLGTHAPAIAKMQSAFLQGAAGATTFGRTAGTLSASFAGLKAAGTGVVSGIGKIGSALGGPLNIALMGAALAFIDINSSIDKSKRQHELLQHAVTGSADANYDLVKALNLANGEMSTEAIDAFTQQVTEARQAQTDLAGKGPGILQKAAAGWADMAASVMGAGSSFRDATFDQMETKDAAERVKSTLDGLGLTNRQLAEGIGGSSEQFRILTGLLDTSTQSGRDTLDWLNLQRQKYEENAEAAKRLTPGIQEVSDNMLTLANSASSASDKSDALKRTLDALAGVPPELGDAMQAYDKVIRDVKETTEEAWDTSKGFSNELLNDNGSVNTATENGDKLRTTLLGIRDATADAATAGADMGPIYEQNEEAFRKAAEAAGLLPEEVQRAAEMLGYNQNAFNLAVTISGQGEVVGTLAIVKAKLQNINPDDPKVVTLKTDSEEAIAALRDAGLRVDQFKDRPGEITVTADTEEAIGRIDAAIAEVSKFSNVTAVPRIDLNSQLFTNKIDHAQGMIDFLAAQTPSPEADLVIGKLQQNKQVSDKEIDALAARVADPKVQLEIRQALADANTANLAIDDASRPREAKLTTSVDQASIDAAAAKLNALVATRRAEIIASTTMTFGEKYTYTTTGQMPGHATGGAIYGPGSGTSDSIPAMLSNGEHVLTASDVAKAGGQGAIYRLRQAIQGGWAHFATGGAVGDAIAAAQSVNGNAYLWSATGPDRFDCSGFIGWLQQILMGLGKSTKRLYTTYSLLSGETAGLVPGLDSSSPFNVGVSQDHMAATLAGHNVESGGSHGTAAIDGPAVGADDGQFPSKFHLPVSLIAGGWDGDGPMATVGETGFGGATNSKWTEKDDLDLQSARVAIEQAKEARDKVNANEKKTDADRQQADLRVAKAEEKVRRLETKRDSYSETKALSTEPAPELTGSMTDEQLEMRSAEIAVTKAQLQRDQTYSDPDSTSLDKEEADMAVYQAQNRLESTRKELAEANKDLKSGSSGESFNLKDRLMQFGSDVIGIMYDSAWEILGIDEPRWLKIDWPSLPTPKAGGDGATSGDPVKDALADVGGFSNNDVMSQLGFNPNGQNWIDDWLKKLPGGTVKDLPIKLYDQGGIIPHGGLGLNLSGKPEGVLTNEQMATLRQVADVGPAAQSADFSVHVNVNGGLVDQRMVDDLSRRIADKQSRALTRYGGRPL